MISIKNMGSLYNFYAYNYPAQNPQQLNAKTKLLVQIIHIKNSPLQDMHNINGATGLIPHFALHVLKYLKSI